MNYFLVFFIDFFFHFLRIQIQNWNLAPVATARYCYRTPAVATVTAVYRTVTDGKKKTLLVVVGVCNPSVSNAQSKHVYVNEYFVQDVL
jgi:hypothetical protein